jgi:hypothetical protein
MPKSKSKSKKPGKRSSAASKYSKLADHALEKGRLRSPFNQLPSTRQSAWRDDHLPLMLWAVLLTEVLPREDYLGCFRTLINLCAEWFRDGGPLAERKRPVDPEDFGTTELVDMQTLAEIPGELFDQFLAVPLRHPLGYAGLRPLLLLASLPNRQRWRERLDTEPQESDWTTLGRAIASTLDHQSERSTDIRWFKLMVGIMAGRIILPQGMDTRIDEYLQYPNLGDMRSVRPSIRAMEMMFRRSTLPGWVQAFWDECAQRTKCVDPTDFEKEIRQPTRLTLKALMRVRTALIHRFFDNHRATEVNPRLDGAFGLVLYALSIVEELGASSMHEGILGRLALRSVVEGAITLQYLAKKDDRAQWAAWRVYGAGQAKLAFLKIQELVGDVPSFYEESELELIANEDRWQEFLDIDVGHWNRSNLRTLAKDGDGGELYDSFYAWTSSFAHSHWGSVRDTNFITCHNPLHRLHRIPRVFHRRTRSVEEDIVKALNGMIAVLDTLYPGSASLPNLGLLQTEEGAVVEAGDTVPHGAGDRVGPEDNAG